MARFDNWRTWPLPTSISAVLAAALIAELLWLTWSLVAPIAPPVGRAALPSARATADPAVLGRFDPFFRIPGPPSAARAEAAGGMRLFGVRSDGRGGGSAILAAAGGVQSTFRVGEEVAQGVTLRAVATDHVVLSRGGSRIRLEFAPWGAGDASSAAPAPPAWAAAPPSPSTSSAGPIDPKAFLAAAGMVARTRDGRPAGYELVPRGRADVLARAGLQPGDVLVAIDGSALNAERYGELPDLLAHPGGVEITFERAGRIMTTRLEIAPN